MSKECSLVDILEENEPQGNLTYRVCVYEVLWLLTTGPIDFIPKHLISASQYRHWVLRPQILSHEKTPPA